MIQKSYIFISLLFVLADIKRKSKIENSALIVLVSLMIRFWFTFLTVDIYLKAIGWWNSFNKESINIWKE